MKNRSVPFFHAVLPALLGLAAYVGYSAYQGWYVGGRPAGWIEGKHLVWPLMVAGLVGAAMALAGSLMAAGSLRVAYAAPSRISVRRAWAALITSLVICGVLVLSVWVPWGFYVLYGLSGWRQGL